MPAWAEVDIKEPRAIRAVKAAVLLEKVVIGSLAFFVERGKDKGFTTARTIAIS
jgi:hypothetical protein